MTHLHLDDRGITHIEKTAFDDLLYKKNMEVLAFDHNEIRYAE